MRTFLRVAALLVALAVVAWWFFGGHHLGWNQSYVDVTVRDPVTGLDGHFEKKQFIPGVEFLAEGLGAAILLAVASFFFKRPPSTLSR